MQIRAGASLALVMLFAVSTRSPAQILSAAANSSFEPPGCFDGTPHTKTLVQVDKKVQLQVLDWGGARKSRTMVLLTGLGDNAHVYDQFAYQFIDYFHVIGITRRGYAPSTHPAPGSKPEEGYTLAARAHDDIAVLDALGIRNAVFVGHSVAGSELSTIGLQYRDRVEKLVYLDAFDLSRRFILPDIPPAPFTEADYRSLQIFLAADERLEDILRPAQSACIAVRFDENGRITDNTTPAWVPKAILWDVQQNPPTDWARLEPPRLGIFNRPSVQGKLPYYFYLNDEDRKKFDDNWPGIVKWYRDTLAEFATEQVGRPKPVVYTLPDAPHYFYLNDQAFVVRVMREFLLGPVGQ